MLHFIAMKEQGNFTHDLDLYRLASKSCDISRDLKDLNIQRCTKVVAGQVDKLRVTLKLVNGEPMDLDESEEEEAEDAKVQCWNQCFWGGKA